MPPETPPLHGRYGVALVEIALVLPVVLSVVGGLTALGRAASITQSLQDSARAGARLAAGPGASNDSVRTTVCEAIISSTGLSADDVTLSIAIEPAPGNDNPGGEIAQTHPKDRIHLAVEVPCERVSWLAGLVFQNAPLRAECRICRE